MQDRPFERILVTGGTGFIGRNVVARLIADGYRPVIAQFGAIPDTFAHADKVEVTNLDLRDVTSVAKLLDDLRPQLVVHLAGVTGHSDPEGRLCNDINYAATADLLDRLAQNNVTKVVMIGSAAEYGQQSTPFFESMPDDPHSAYAVSRSRATRHAMSLALTKGLPVTVLRLFSVYGIGQPANMFLPQLIEHAVAGRRFEMTGGRQLRDFVHVEDVALAILQAASSSTASGQVINIAGGEGHRLSTVAKTVWSYCEAAPDLLEIGSTVARGDDAFDTLADIRLAKAILDWYPIRKFITNDVPDEGLIGMIEAMREGT